MAASRHTENANLYRLQTGELEIGVTEALQRHITRTIHQPPPVSQRRLDFEQSRPRWLREMGAEALGVFLYVSGFHSQRSRINFADSLSDIPESPVPHLILSMMPILPYGMPHCPEYTLRG